MKIEVKLKSNQVDNHFQGEGFVNKFFFDISWNYDVYFAWCITHDKQLVYYGDQKRSQLLKMIEEQFWLSRDLVQMFNIVGLGCAFGAVPTSIIFTRYKHLLPPRT